MRTSLNPVAVRMANGEREQLREMSGRMYESGDLIGRRGHGKWVTPGFWFKCLNDGPCTKKGNRKDSRLGLMEIMTSQGEFSKLM